MKLVGFRTDKGRTIIVNPCNITYIEEVQLSSGVLRTCLNFTKMEFVYITDNVNEAAYKIAQGLEA